MATNENRATPETGHPAPAEPTKQDTPTGPESQVKTAALKYAAAGIKVFPCKRDKSPLTDHGFKDATCDQATIEEWFTKWPGAAIGTPTGQQAGYFVFDVDLYKPGCPEAFETLKAGRELPQTKTQRTGSGGRQYFFIYPEGMKIKSRAGQLGTGLDVKADGGYTILPPSENTNGRYQWIDERPPADAPEWLLDAVSETPKPPATTSHRATTGDSTAYGLKALEDEAAKVRQANEGTRNETLNHAAFKLGQLVAGGQLGLGITETALMDASMAAGLSEREARRTLESGLNSGLSEPRRPEQDGRHTSTSTAPDSEPEALPTELLPVEPFDFELLPDTLSPWAADIAERMQCPGDFVGSAVMAALAGIIGRKVGIRPQERTDWTAVCNMWFGNIGRPATLKSPAAEAALSPTKQLAARAADRYAEDFREYQAAAAIVKLKKEAAEKHARKKIQENPGATTADLLAVFAADEPEPPAVKRYIANDSTPAALGELLRQNPNGLLVYRDELVSLLKTLDREDAAEGRGFYLTAWNGDSSYTFDRIARGLNLYIPAVCFSLLGSTQPGRFSEYIRHAVKGGAGDDGLVQRINPIWPDVNGTWKDVDRWPDGDAKRQAFQVFDRLDRLDPLGIGAKQDFYPDNEPDGIPYFRFDAGGLGLFREWRQDHERKLRGDLHPALESHLAKYRKTIPGIALIIHLAEGGTGPVTERATLKALAWSEYLESHARRAYGSVSQPEIAVSKAILRRIRKGDLKPTFKSYEVWRPGWSSLSDRDQVLSALRLLEDYNWIRTEKVETGGRPATLYHAHKKATG